MSSFAPLKRGMAQALSANPFSHAETLLEACKAAWEVDFRDTREHEEAFQRLLQTSIKIDQQNKAAELQIRNREVDVKAAEAQTRQIAASADAMRAHAETANPYSMAATNPAGIAA